METVLGRGYSISEEFGITDFYSPPSSIIDKDEELADDLFYPQEENNHIELTNNLTLSSSSINQINNTNSKDWLKPLPLKLMSIETTTPPPTPLMPRRLLDPINNTTTAFQNMTINTNLSITPTKITDKNTPNWPLNTSSISPLFPCTKTNTPKTTTNMDRYLIEHRHLSDSIYKSSTTLGATTNTHQSISVQHTEVNNEASRLYSYMDHVDGLSSNVRTVCTTSSNSWSTFDDRHSMPSQISINKNSYIPQINMKPPPCLNNSLFPQRMNSVFPNSNNSFSHASSFQHQQYQSHDPWFLSEMSTIVHQNQQNTNILLSTTAQQILAANTTNNNRPLRSEKIDMEIIKHLIQEANWKRQCGMKKEVCVFCRNNGENELIYSSHSLKDSIGNVTCPILRAYQCPICGATGSQAHTIKYCQATGDDNNRHVPTPYEKMLRMQTFGFDDNITSSIPGLFNHIGSPTSLYTNGWSDSYL
ncbi:unnamed protein product [Rotaria sordida]|uniref:Nanos-type domain-containing protein n=1 Tax=Rotaria sordida TaxID=392033 RepID=A0A814RMV6_9BILA|nr:unnamed protein product [Rotaria sordida]CAF3624484.1 unnamed protein product [Rotaria sordida]